MDDHNADRTDTNGDGLPGGYDTVDGIKSRARALDQPVVADAIETIEATVEREPQTGHYGMDGMQPMAYEHGNVGVLFYLGVLVGCALEREYPGDTAQPDDQLNTNGEDIHE